MGQLTKATGLLALTGLQAVQQRFEDASNRLLDPKQVRFEVRPERSELSVTAREMTTEGESGRFSGTVTLTFDKVDIATCLPYPILLQGTYPLTYYALCEQLRSDYGLIFEERELATATDPDSPLLNNDYIEETVESSTGTVTLIVTPYSGRFLAGGVVALIIAQPHGRRRLSDLYKQTKIPNVGSLLETLRSEGSQTLYGAGASTIAQELIKRQLYLDIDTSQCQYFLRSLNFHQVKVVLTPATVNLPQWEGMAEFVYEKADLESILPDHLTANIPYPTTFRALSRYLEQTYGFVIHAGEFAAGSMEGPLLGESPDIDAPLDDKGYLSLFVTKHSFRWLGRGVLKIQFVNYTRNTSLPVIVNDASDGGTGVTWRHTHVVEPAVEGVVFSLVKGTPPAPLNPQTGSYQGTAPAGEYIWTVRVKAPGLAVGTLKTEMVRIEEGLITVLDAGVVRP